MDERTRLLTGSGAPNNDCPGAEPDGSYVIEPIEDARVISSDATVSESSCGPEGMMPS